MIAKQAFLLFAVLAGAASVLGDLSDWNGGLRVRFGIGFSGYFMSMPRSVAEAKTNRWVQVTRPDGPLESLIMYCPEDYLFCVLYDDIEYIAGVQIALPQDRYTDSVFDWETQGYTSWTPDGSDTAYWTLQQFFVDEDILATDADERLAAYDESMTLQHGKVWLVGINKELLEVTITVDGALESGFTEQACIPLMGRHYYYNMTTTTECTSSQIYPWFPLTASGDIIGMGFVSAGQLSEDDLDTDYFERPGSSAVEAIVPNGPQCLYDLADTPGLVTMHIYYINNPLLLTCILQ